MRINAEVSMIFDGFNESVNIKLPAEAKKAQPFPMGLMVSTQAVPIVPVGNETMVNETQLKEMMLNLNETMQENSTTQAVVTA
jgi:hypothetical protein